MIPCVDQLGYDACQRQVVTEFLTWHHGLIARGGAGALTEIGWPNNRGADTALWNALAEQFYRQADRVGMPVVVWNAQREPGYPLSVYDSSGGNNDMSVATAIAPIIKAHSGTLRGVNLFDPSDNSDLLGDGGSTAMAISTGGVFSQANLGVVGTDYYYPTAGDFTYMASQGVKLVRICIRWERLQPTLLSALASAELARLTTAISNANAVGIGVVVCLWNNGGYFFGTTTSDSHFVTLQVANGGSLVQGHFTDFWTRLSTALKGSAGLVAYDPMNEPSLNAEGTASGSNLVTNGVNGTFEGNVTGWSATGGAATYSTTQAHAGTGSLKITGDGTGQGAAVGGYVITVTPGSTYLGSGWWRAGSTSRQFAMQVDWQNAGGGYLSSSFGTFVNGPSTQWSESTGAFTAPANAVKAQVKMCTVDAIANTEVHYVDDVAIYLASTPYTPKHAWEILSQAALTAIRNNGDNTPYWCLSYGGASPAQFFNDHPTLWLTDPASAVRYCTHFYWDFAGGIAGGTYGSTYAQELAAAIAAGY